MISVSVRYLHYHQWIKRSNHGPFVFPPKKSLIWRRHCSIGQSCCSMTSKRSIDCFLESSASPTKSHARLCPFNKPIKSLYFRLFVVSVLFVRFHFKVIRKSLYHGIVRASTCFSTEGVSKSRRVRSLLSIRSSEGSSPVVEYGVFR